MQTTVESLLGVGIAYHENSIANLAHKKKKTNNIVNRIDHLKRKIEAMREQI